VLRRKGKEGSVLMPEVAATIIRCTGTRVITSRIMAVVTAEKR
jgi:hypothetical protein